MSEVLSCARGCTSRGRHLSDCPDQEACAGCQPRTVEPGAVLCRACIGQTIRALLSLGELAVWIRENVERGSRGDSKDVNVVAHAWAPLSIDALTDLDEMVTTLATWTMLAVEEHPAGLKGPDWRGARVVPDSKRATETMGIVYDGARVVGLRATEDVGVIEIAAAWIKTHVDWFIAQPWADSWHDEITQCLRSAQAKWPQTVRARKTPLPCPEVECNEMSLWWHPPAEEGQEASVICHNDACGRVLTIADYYIAVRDKQAELNAAA